MALVMHLTAATKSISSLTIAGTRSRVESVLPETSEGIGSDWIDGCGVAINDLYTKHMKIFMYYVYFLSLFCCKAFCTLLLLPLSHS